MLQEQFDTHDRVTFLTEHTKHMVLQCHQAKYFVLYFAFGHLYIITKCASLFCHACDNPFTVKHILVECSDFTHIRNKYYTTTDVHTLFREVDSSKSLNSSRKSNCSTKCKFTSNTIYRETRIFNVYTFIF